MQAERVSMTWKKVRSKQQKRALASGVFIAAITAAEFA